MSQFTERTQTEQAFCEAYFDYLIPIINISMAIVMIPVFYKYIKLKSESIKNKCLFWTGLVFFSLIFLCHILWAIGSIYFCHDLNAFAFISNIWSQLYVLQLFLLLAILFARLYYPFKGTAFGLSTLTIKTYCILYTIAALLLVAGAIAYSNFYNTFIGLLILGLAWLMMIIVMMTLVILFIYKLMQVYKSIDGDTELIATITKTSLLCFISISSSLFLAIAGIITPSTGSVHVNLIVGLFTTNDMFTNFWCVVLGFKRYHQWYLQGCKCCDSKCRSCWYKCAGKDGKDANMMMKEIVMAQIEATVSTSTPSNPSSQQTETSQA